jgi:redox-sensitive transcriptional activator SoxR
VLRRLAVIRVAQRVGMPLEAVGRAFESLPDGRAPTKADWARLSARWRTELEERIHMLQLLRDELTGCIGCGCLSLQHCRLAVPATSSANAATADALGVTTKGRRGLCRLCTCDLIPSVPFYQT